MEVLAANLRAHIVGLGTDLAEVDRIAHSLERFGDKFTTRLFTPAEIAYVERKANKAERYAARFAAKEAGMKAIGTGWAHGVKWHDFEVTNQASGAPTLVLRGKAAEIAQRLGARHVHLSLTHAQTLAMAIVILEA